MEELTIFLSQFGDSVLLGLILYRVLSFVEFLGVAWVITLLVKRAWPHLKEYL